MAKKFFETDDEIKVLVMSKFEESGLSDNGVTLQVISTTKGKEVIKIAKTSEPTEFLTDTDNAIQIFVYEDVFNRLDASTQNFLLEMAFDSVYYDSDKNKVTIESNPYFPLFDMRRKYGERADEMLEASYLAIKQYKEQMQE